MTKLAILSVAATALIPASLMAQTVAPPEPWQDTPKVELDLPKPPPAPAAPPVSATPPAGVTWQRPAVPPVAVAPSPAPVPVQPTPAPAPQARLATPPAPIATSPVRAPVPVQAPAPLPPAPPAPAVAVQAAPPPPAVPATPAVPQVARVERGYVMPPYWMAPQFEVRDWRDYGFAAPAADQRWLRYYDEALLVDAYGRVVDVRHDVGWDARRESWAYDQRGVPVYVGNGAYYPGSADYAYVQGYAGDHYAVRQDSYPAQSYAYPSSPYGYGYGYGGMTIIETTVTTQGGEGTPQVVVREYPPVVAPMYPTNR